MVLLPGCACCGPPCGGMNLHLATAVEVTIEANDTHRSCAYLCKFKNEPDFYYLYGQTFPFGFANGTWSLSKYSHTDTSAIWTSNYDYGSPFTEDFSEASFPELGTKPGISVRLNASSQTGLRQVEVRATALGASVQVSGEKNSYSSSEMISLRNSETYPYTNTSGFAYFCTTFEFCDDAKPSLLPEVLTTKLPAVGWDFPLLACAPGSGCSTYDQQSNGTQSVFKVTSVKIFTG